MRPDLFFASLRSRNSGVFGTSLSQSQVDGINGILKAFDEVGDGRRATLAYALATAYWETGRRMIPVREGFASTNEGAIRAVQRLANKRGPSSAVAKYVQPAGPYGHVYYGRGLVQLTWLHNYRNSSADAGVDLVKNPDAMLDPRISARVLIRGLIDGRWNGRGKGVAYYEMLDGLPGLSEIEAIAARRTVNVQDKASLIAGIYRSFSAALEAGGWPLDRPVHDVMPYYPDEPTSAPTRPATPPRPPSAPQRSASAPNGILAALLSRLLRFLNIGGPA